MTTSRITVIPDGVVTRTCPACNGWGWTTTSAATSSACERKTCWCCLGAGSVWAYNGQLAPLRDLPTST